MALYETIPYNVIRKDGPIEIREYNDYLLASTKTQLNNRMDSGFNNVFNYISGQNTAKEKISMTTPVVSYQEEDNLVTGFYVPSKYNKESVPKPASTNVFINEQESSLYGVIRFRGAWTDHNFSKQEETLRTYLTNNNYTITSQRLIFRYTPPFVPGVLRRNEIAFKISK
ncbi:SOUL family heme-binding protein [Candidatus Xianfuyuplasma coldseepsis]|uniref:Heme-binding protein n=1 Tax=Candidatus Xianfuyuplasma coldseepsis TaxID=2782163 RepID=A0A7L7KQR1_9MOLU|nr:heme-binding protein [Xianfuyuplasma coldseepsis]QMS85151.1 heme-binding protein [Xianfuyuplasma coldseepsis]